MSKKIYIGNLNYRTTDETLASVFSQFGEIDSARVVKDRMTEQSKGFGFVEFKEDGAVADAISAMNGQDLDGRRVRVSIADERPPRQRSYDDGDKFYSGNSKDGSSRKNYRY